MKTLSLFNYLLVAGLRGTVLINKSIQKIIFKITY